MTIASTTPRRVAAHRELGKSFVEQKLGERTLKAGYSWYRGDVTNFIPSLDLLKHPNAIHDYFLKGLVPESPFITENTNIVSFGSCFADNISKYLNALNYNVLTKKNIKSHVVTFGEGMVHTYAIRQQFEWSLEDKEVNQELWIDKSKNMAAMDAEIKNNTRNLFLNADLFILTFGLSEVWYSKETGDVFWRGIPEKSFNRDKHGFRLVSPAENADNIRAIYKIIRKHRPDARVVFTLSPVPLVATFRPQPCIVSNSASKASIKIALDEIMREYADDKKLFYWPSYEIVTDFFSVPFGTDRRHIQLSVLKHIMRLFEEFYCIPNSSRIREPLVSSLIGAMIFTRDLPQAVAGPFKRQDFTKLKAAIEKAKALGQEEYALLLTEGMKHYKHLKPSLT